MVLMGQSFPLVHLLVEFCETFGPQNHHEFQVGPMDLNVWVITTKDEGTVGSHGT